MTTNSVLFNKEPLWQENRHGTRHKLPEAVQSWTYESGSLTQRLRATYGNAVAVKVLFQQWRVPFLTERQSLGLHEQRVCLTREVLLHANGKPLILARTILPSATIKIANRSLSKLGTRPLGEVIFSYPHLERIAMDVSLINPNEWTTRAVDVGHIQQPIWGRRTVYAIKHRQMLVIEFFLPNIL
ncbi:MAG: chorismate lyase [Methylococcales bacterium]